MSNDGERRQVKQVRSGSVRARAGGAVRERPLLPAAHAPDIVSAARLNPASLDALFAIVPYPPSEAALRRLPESARWRELEAHTPPRAGAVRSLRLHGDCHGGNVLWLPDGPLAGPHFVDFDDSRTGPALQDLWMLLSGDRTEKTRGLADLLAGYEDFQTFNRRELLLLEALRTLRLVHYAAWLARRWDDPAFPAAFPWFNTQRYWQDRILELREQVAAMDEPPLAV